MSHSESHAETGWHSDLPALPDGLELCLGEATIGEAAQDELGPGESAMLRRLGSARRQAELAAGRVAARRALGKLLGDAGAAGIEVLGEPDGAPRVAGIGAPVAVSITHGRHRALAVVGRVHRLGIDLCDLAEAPRLQELALRFVPEELPLLSTPWSYAACWAAKEAALKALGLGLLDGGLFEPEASAVRILALEPEPRLNPPHLQLALALHREAALAVVWSA